MVLMQNILDDYHNYICDLMRFNTPEHRKYRKLIFDLNRKEFVWSMMMDEQRDIDGMNLRREFLQTYYPNEDIGMYLFPRSVLEVLAAFSRTIEIQIMGEPGNDHIERWFWEMLDNLGLLVYDDKHYDAYQVDKILDIWLQRKFKKDGTGSIFPVKNWEEDLTKVDMWYEMQFYMNVKYPI